MRKLRVLVLMHEDLVPPDDPGGLDKEQRALIQTELDVCTTLEELGHQVRKLGVRHELGPIRYAVKRWEPHIVFNLLEEFRDVATFDQHMVAYLELLGVPYTGCNPRGLVLARDKALSKKVLAYHRIAVPGFATFAMGRKPKRPRALKFPLIVKSLIEEASLGIAKASLVENDEKLYERIRFIHRRLKTDAIAEEFIEGRELYASVLGNQRLTCLPVWELVFKRKDDDEPLIATAKAKWDLAYQKKWGVGHGPAKRLPDGMTKQINRVSKRIYRGLGLSGYARLDYRLSNEGKLYFLEANPNPDIARKEEFSSAAKLVGIDYPKLIQRVLSLGLSRFDRH